LSWLPRVVGELVCFVCLGALLGACEVSFPHSSRPTVSLHMTGKPPDAAVTIDEEFVGPLAVVAARGVALPTGTHQITVEAPGYFPWDKLVTADSRVAKTLDVAVELIPLPR
jgi:hypothetical protein